MIWISTRSDASRKKKPSWSQEMLRTRSIVLGKRLTVPPSTGDGVVDVYDDQLVLSRTGATVRVSPHNEQTPMIEPIGAIEILDAHMRIDGGRLPLLTSTTTYTVVVSRSVVGYHILLRYRAAEEATLLLRLRFEYPYRSRSYSHVVQRKLDLADEQLNATKTLPVGASRICSKI